MELVGGIDPSTRVISPAFTEAIKTPDRSHHLSAGGYLCQTQGVGKPSSVAARAPY